MKFSILIFSAAAGLTCQAQARSTVKDEILAPYIKKRLSYKLCSVRNGKSEYLSGKCITYSAKNETGGCAPGSVEYGCDAANHDFPCASFRHAYECAENYSRVGDRCYKECPKAYEGYVTSIYDDTECIPSIIYMQAYAGLKCPSSYSGWEQHNELKCTLIN